MIKGKNMWKDVKERMIKGKYMWKDAERKDDERKE